jgi:hypothetical protein
MWRWGGTTHVVTTSAVLSIASNESLQLRCVASLCMPVVSTQLFFCERGITILKHSKSLRGLKLSCMLLRAKDIGQIEGTKA